MNPTTIRSRCGQLVGDSVTNITSAFEASFAVTEMALGIPWFFAEFTPTTIGTCRLVLVWLAS